MKKPKKPWKVKVKLPGPLVKDHPMRLEISQQRHALREFEASHKWMKLHRGKSDLAKRLERNKSQLKVMDTANPKVEERRAILTKHSSMLETYIATREAARKIGLVGAQYGRALETESERRKKLKKSTKTMIWKQDMAQRAKGLTVIRPLGPIGRDGAMLPDGIGTTQNEMRFTIGRRPPRPTWEDIKDRMTNWDQELRTNEGVRTEEEGERRPFSFAGVNGPGRAPSPDGATTSSRFGGTTSWKRETSSSKPVAMEGADVRRPLSFPRTNDDERSSFGPGGMAAGRRESSYNQSAHRDEAGERRPFTFSKNYDLPRVALGAERGRESPYNQSANGDEAGGRRPFTFSKNYGPPIVTSGAGSRAATERGRESPYNQSAHRDEAGGRRPFTFSKSYDTPRVALGAERGRESPYNQSAHGDEAGGRRPSTFSKNYGSPIVTSGAGNRAATEPVRDMRGGAWRPEEDHRSVPGNDEKFVKEKAGGHRPSSLPRIYGGSKLSSGFKRRTN